MKPRFSSYNSGKRGKGKRSKNEEVVAEALGLTGHPFSYESVKLPYVKQHSYLPDFTLHNHRCHVECKGYWPAEDRAKMLAVARCNPDVIVVMVLIKPELTISKASKTTYSQWCDRHGIPWCSFSNDPALLKERLETLLRALD
jgi:hypothetical protein